MAAAKGVLSALRFAAHKLGIRVSWLASDKWSAVCPKEAYPLPLWVVAKLEIAFLDCGNEGAWLLGCMLLMIWGGFPWSDAQRLQLATLTIDKKKRVAFSKKGKSREGSSRRLLGAAELAEQKALFDEAKQTIVFARRLLQK